MNVNLEVEGAIMPNKEFWDMLEELVSNSEIVIDRPKGTVHPKYPDFV